MAFTNTVIDNINIGKLSIQDLKASELFDQLPVAVYTCDSLGRITSFNSAAAKLWGREPEIGKDLWCGSWKIFNPDGTPLPLDTCPMARTLKEGVAVEGEEIIIQRPDGSYRNILPYPVPKFDAGGTLIGAIITLIDFTGIARDIAFQKKADENQALLAAIVDTSDDTIISKTLQGMITSWNKAAERMFGYTKEEVLGKHISLLIPPARLREEEVIIGNISKGNKVDHFETIRIAKNGREIPISLSVSPVKDSTGKIIGASKVARDITLQKQTENRLHRDVKNLEILNALGKKITATMDARVILQKITDATMQLTGAGFGIFFYNKIDEKGVVNTLYASSGNPEAIELFKTHGNTGIFHSPFNGEKIIKIDQVTSEPGYSKDKPLYGMPLHFAIESYLALPVLSTSGVVIGGLFFGHPEPGKFTEEHELLASAIAVQAMVALENAKLYEEIRALNLMKDEFIGMASHELKTPVTSIKGYLQIVERNMPEGKSKAFVSKASLQVSKLTSLISDLLDVSKIEAGKLPFSYTVFNLRVLLNDIKDIMQYTNSSHTMKLLCPDKLLMIEADKQRFEQLIINLVSNAVKYSPDGQKVIIRAKASGDRIIISIQDFGIGIAADQLKRIFSRFHRVENLAGHMSGLGIGLYISQEIVNGHQGKLWVKSIPGKGSTFFIEMPVRRPLNGVHL